MKNEDLVEILIDTLQYNASMVALCSLYYGNCNNSKIAKKAQKDIINLQDRYIKTLESHNENNNQRPSAITEE